jgi:hypothetical protein
VFLLHSPCGLPVMTFVPLLDVGSSQSSTTPLPQEDSTPNSAETDVSDDADWLFSAFDEIFRTVPDSILHHFAAVQRYLHTNVSGFSTEVCDAKESSPCVYIYGSDSFVNGSETCSVYTIGSCDDDIRR